MMATGPGGKRLGITVPVSPCLATPAAIERRMRPAELRNSLVDLTGFEPVTSCLPSKRSTN